MELEENDSTLSLDRKTVLVLGSDGRKLATVPQGRRKVEARRRSLRPALAFASNSLIDGKDVENVHQPTALDSQHVYLYHCQLTVGESQKISIIS